MPERWKTESKKLRRVFDDTVERIWDLWKGMELEGSPFKNLQNVLETAMEEDEIREFYWDVAWARGVSEATGWPLTQWGTKGWSPRG